MCERERERKKEREREKEKSKQDLASQVQVKAVEQWCALQSTLVISKT